MRRNLYKLQVVLAVILIVFWISCQGVGSGGGGSSDTDSGAARGLRFGVSESAVGPVATTAQLNSGESIVVLTPSSASQEIAFLMYTIGDLTARITLDGSDRPATAITGDLQCFFGNYTSTTVDLRLISVDENGQARDLGQTTVPLPPPVAVSATGAPTATPNAANEKAEADLTSLDQRNLAILGRAATAVSLWGCTGTSSLLSLSVPQSRWSQLAVAACNSSLVRELVQRAVTNTPVADVPLATFDLNPSCNYAAPNWGSSVQGSEDCAQGILQDRFFAENVAPPGGGLSGGSSSSGGFGGGGFAGGGGIGGGGGFGGVVGGNSGGGDVGGGPGGFIDAGGATAGPVPTNTGPGGDGGPIATFAPPTQFPGGPGGGTFFPTSSFTPFPSGGTFFPTFFPTFTHTPFPSFTPFFPPTQTFTPFPSFTPFIPPSPSNPPTQVPTFVPPTPDPVGGG